jgi:hypothetical protein
MTIISIVIPTYNSSKFILKKDTYILKNLENNTWMCNYCYNVGLDNLYHT